MRIQQNNREARGHVRKSAVRLVAIVVGRLVTAGVRYGTLPLRMIANKKKTAIGRTWPGHRRLSGHATVLNLYPAVLCGVVLSVDLFTILRRLHAS